QIRRSSFSCTTPCFTRMLGLPLMNARRRWLFRLSSERALCSTSRVSMGATPYSSGVPTSSMGVAASSAIIMAMTSSKGWSWLTWRLSIMRMTRTAVKNRMAARSNTMSMRIPPRALVWRKAPRINPQQAGARAPAASQAACRHESFASFLSLWYTMAMLISIVVPCYNEEDALPLFKARFDEATAGMDEARFELLLVDDGSRDGTLSLCHRLAGQDARVRVLSLA